MRIRRLSEGTINRIAAGEVIERPASVVKELVENAMDAGASSIDVVIQAGGRTLIQVIDDGGGMSAEELELAVERHATSKLEDDELVRIETLGFRGEALPSIGSVSRLSIISRARDRGDANEIRIDGGKKGDVRPAAHATGTTIEVRDLFYAVPARLKFLKSERAEAMEISAVLRRLAMPRPDIGFSLKGDGRRTLDLPAGEPGSRISGVMGRDFLSNSVPIDYRRDTLRIEGMAGLPTFSRGQTNLQFIYVNGRPVSDKLLLGALRGAYADFIMRGRHPAAVLFITCPPQEVDVNVHPGKAEVRFRDGQGVRSLIVNGIRTALSGGGLRSSSAMSEATMDAFRPERPLRPSFPQRSAAYSMQAPQGLAETASQFEGLGAVAAEAARASGTPGEPVSLPLGAARAQLHENYIIAQTRDGLVIVDQHAAHERLVYERMKASRAAKDIATQPLLVPEVVELEPGAVERLATAVDELASVGLVLEAFGPSAVVVREVPALLAEGDIQGLVRDVADELDTLGSATEVGQRVDHVLATMACYGSVRSGRRLKPEEMNQLLRDMEATPEAGQCNHGRPTYVELKLSEIERLFGRR